MTRSFSRRAVIRGALAGGGLLAGAGGRALASTVATDPARLADAKAMWEWEQMMVGLGPRFTGSTQHVQYLDFLELECQRVGLVTRHDPTQYFPRWDADYTRCRLAIGTTDVEVMSYFPGSGSTSRLAGGALRAPLVDAGQGLPEDFAAAIATGSFKGAIAFCTEAPLPVTEVLGYPSYYNDDPHRTMTPLTPYDKWSLNILSPQSVLTTQLAQVAGCAGMVIALQATRQCALGQYVPFAYKVIGDQAGGAPGLPTLYVDYQTGQDLKSRLAGRPTARLVLPATVYPHTGSDEILAFLPGVDGDARDWSKGENVVVASHTDGTSGSEENGPLGMLALAKYFARIPRSKRRRSMVFVFATGHFTGYTQDTSWFTAHHPELIAKCAATLTIEHLGQKSYTDNPRTGTYAFDGYPEVGISYVSQEPAIIETVTQSYQAANLVRAPVINGPGFGVGTAFFTALLPSFAYITGPNALYQMDQRTVLRCTDPVRMYQEVSAFVRILSAWEQLSKPELAFGPAVIEPLRAALP